MNPELTFLATAAAALGFGHALLGPDHYLPFIAMSRARNWSLERTLGLSLACGVGHISASLALGALAVFVGWALGGLEWIQAVAKTIAGWLLLGFGLAYLTWGVRQIVRNRTHHHWHVHDDGTIHCHEHSHRGDHSHVHDSTATSGRYQSIRYLTPWVLFVALVLGPCEPLVPLLMVPAANSNWWGVGLVAITFGLTTLVTMLAMVTAGHLGLSRLPFGPFERYSHVLAGLTLLVCGAAVTLGF